MQRKPGFTSAISLIVLLVFAVLAPDIQAQTAPPTPQELDQLLAPIALYPDALLAQITTASTNPQEILDVNNWLAQNPNLTSTALSDAAQQQGFDPAFIALVQFPTVLQMMAENIDDYAAIGQAVTANQAEVTASIQRLRAQAYASGALRSSSQQNVEAQQANGQTIYVIQPANQQVVYVPQYDPTVVYTGPSTGAVVTASLITFGLGIGIGALLYSNAPWGWHGWGWNWGGRSIYYNHGAWGGWHGGYHPPHAWYRPRPIYYGNRPGYGGNWHYRPPNYHPPRPVNRPVYHHPGTYPGNRPGTKPVNRPGNPQPGHRPPGNRPVTQPARPMPNTRPTQPRPNQPHNQPRPTTHPTTRPAPQPRPTQQQQHSRPSSQQHSRPSSQQHRPTQQHSKPASHQSSSRPAGKPASRPHK